MLSFRRVSSDRSTTSSRVIFGPRMVLSHQPESLKVEAKNHFTNESTDGCVFFYQLGATKNEAWLAEVDGVLQITIGWSPSLK